MIQPRCAPSSTGCTAWPHNSAVATRWPVTKRPSGNWPETSKARSSTLPTRLREVADLLGQLARSESDRERDEDNDPE